MDEQGAPINGAEIVLGDIMCETPDTKVQSGADGGFAIKDAPEEALWKWAGPTMLIKVTAKGLATELLELPAQRLTKGVEVRLKKGTPLRGRITDLDGKPIPGAFASARSWRGYPVLNWGARADAEGRFTWQEAPPDSVVFTFDAQGFRTAKNIKLTATAEEHTIILQPPLKITGRVFNVKDGAPIPDFVLSAGKKWEGHAPHFEEREQTEIHNDGGNYEVSIEEGADLPNMTGDKVIPGQHLVRIEAKGFRGMISKPISNDENNVKIDFRLEPAVDSHVVVRGPDGKPVGNAVMVIGGIGNPIHLENSKAVHNEGKVKLVADADGGLNIPPQSSNPFAMILHDVGLWRGNLNTAIEAGTVDLTAWARLEVETSEDVKPGSHSPFHIDFKPLGESPSKVPDYYFNMTPTIEKAGLVVFERMPPGYVRVGTFYQNSNYADELTLEAGKTTRIQREKEVYQVSGAIHLPEAKEVVWERLRASLELKLPSPRPWPKDLTIQERREWLDKTEEGKAFMKSGRHYMANLRSDGTFAFERIPPGTYQLTIPIKIYAADKGEGAESLGLVRKEFRVSNRQELDVMLQAAGPNANSPKMPTSSVAIHLPNLEKDILRQLKPGASFPDLKVQTLSGETCSLAKPGSEHCLIIFWSSFYDLAPKFNEQINSVQDAYPAHKLKVIAINIDETLSQMEHFLKKHPSRCTQVFLGEEKMREWEKQLGPIWMFTRYLIDSNGNVKVRPQSQELLDDLKKLIQ